MKPFEYAGEVAGLAQNVLEQAKVRLKYTSSPRSTVDGGNKHSKRTHCPRLLHLNSTVPQTVFATLDLELHTGLIYKLSPLFHHHPFSRRS